MDKAPVLVLFDVDGTLTVPRQKITSDFTYFLEQLKEKVTVGIVGGSDLTKISEQVSSSDKDVTKMFEYVFSENGLVGYHNGELFHQKSIADFMGEDKLQQFINYTLHLFSDIKLPCKRGNFVEFRHGMINISPIGRSCTQSQRDEFDAYDKLHGVRLKVVEQLKNEFQDSGLKFSIGGQISIDVFPDGWDKRYCLQFLEKKYSTIHFFGDKTFEGGNDYEIFSDTRTIGHTVNSPADCKRQLEELFF